MKAPLLSLIVAVAENGTIGRDGKLPWRMKADLAFFRRTTMGKPIVMGRHTFESLREPLPGRPNHVVSRRAGASWPGVAVSPSLDRAFERATPQAASDEEPEIVVIGGAGLYAEALPRAGRLYVSRILAHVEGDTHFALPDREGWDITEVERIAGDADNDYDAVVERWDRVPTKA